jgi:hypothetical protein
MQNQKMIHEQEFENYGIDPKKVYEKSGVAKSLPPDWIPEIVNQCINSTKIPRIHHNLNKQERSFVLGFESQEFCDKFYKEFNSNLFKITNEFIKNIKKQKPEDYNRIIVLEVTTNGQQLIIRY